MPEVNATYKCGITFDRWCTKPGFESYFHPFASMLDNLTLTPFVYNAQARVNGADAHAHPDRFFVSAALAKARKAPRHGPGFPFDVWYGYHFDAVLLGKYLHRKAVERVLVNAAIKKALCREAGKDRAWLATVRPYWGHDYHMHIRIRCPKDSPDCKPQDPPPAGDGQLGGRAAHLDRLGRDLGRPLLLRRGDRRQGRANLQAQDGHGLSGRPGQPLDREE